MKDKTRKLLDIFITFAKISPITFGGGFAMIPALEAKVVEKKKWLEREKIADVFAVAQSVPGAVGINSAIFLGYRIAGAAGALWAMLGMILPTFAIILLLSVAFTAFQANATVEAALKGIRPVIIAMIAAAAYKIAGVSLTDAKCWVIAILSMVLPMIFRNLSIIIIIAAGALAGVFISKTGSMFKLAARLYKKAGKGDIDSKSL